MTYSLLFTYSSIAFMVILITIYFNKQIFDNTRTRFYKALILFTAIFTVSELIPVYIVQHVKNYGIYDEIFWKMHWIFGIIWFYIFFNYCLVIIKNIDNKSIFKTFFSSTLTKIVSVIYIVFIVLYLFLPYNSILVVSGNDRGISYMPGSTSNILGVISFILFGFILFLLFKYKEHSTKNERFSILVSIAIILGTLILQIFIRHVSFIPLGFSLFMLSLYFNLENPDIAIISEIANAQGDIEKSNKTKTDFLSNMTYEIKVPMNLISSLCDELVNMSTFDEKLVRDDIMQIQTSGNNLLDIINNILDISKIESGKDNLQEREYNISEIINNIINIAKTKLGAKPVKLEVNIDQNISSGLYGDSAKIYQSLLNIIGNSVKYTEVGRIIFTVTSTKNSGFEKLLFKIYDTGSGIKEEDQGKLFSKFTRLENAVENEIEGSGLGLVITKRYIESMGGKVWFETQYRVGTTFYIELTQKITNPTTIGETIKTVKPVTGEKLDCSNYKALIVDDNNLNIKVAKRLLEGYKFNIESVTSGKDCIYKIKEGLHYDIIFMDHMMPEMDGIETLHVLKKLDGYQLPPIIALTANAIAGMKEMYLKEGFDDYLSKPINTNELDRVVNKFFNK